MCLMPLYPFFILLFFSTCPYLYICNSCILCMYIYIYIYIYICQTSVVCVLCSRLLFPYMVIYKSTPSVSRRHPRLTDPAVRGRSRRRSRGKPTHRRQLPLVRRSRGKPTRRPRSLGPPPAVASSSPPAPAVQWSSQPVMVSPAGRGRILTRL